MKFSEFWESILRLYEQDGIDFESMIDADQIKDDYRGLWYDGLDPEEAYSRLS